MYRDNLKRGKHGCREFVKTMTDAELETLIEDARFERVPYEDPEHCLVGHRLLKYQAYTPEWFVAGRAMDWNGASANYRLLGLIEREKASITESDPVRNRRILWIALAERNYHRPKRILAQVRPNSDARVEVLA